MPISGSTGKWYIIDFEEIMRKDKEKKKYIKQYQINRAKEYVEKHKSTNGSEDTLEVCIISDLLKLI